jgi:phage FluMu protein Com
MADEQIKTRYVSKKCPECLTPMPLNANRCTACNQRLGEINKIGIAKRPVDWLSYVYAIAAVGALGYFTYWLFFR